MEDAIYIGEKQNIINKNKCHFYITTTLEKYEESKSVIADKRNTYSHHKRKEN